MGPRSWDRGEILERLAPAHHAIRASMGPRSWDRGEYATHTIPMTHGYLQWGRGLGTAESLLIQDDDGTELVPSMGPRSWDRGEQKQTSRPLERFARPSMGPRSWDRGESRRSIADAARVVLQWGRGLGTAESTR